MRGLTSGKGPTGLATAALYIASILLDDKRTQKEIAEKSGITEVTVRNRYRDIVDNITIVVEL
jgi:transcription initiation factor TFIIB